MSFKEPIKVLMEILISEMELDADRVLIYNNKWILPNDLDIFISLRNGSLKTISNRTTEDDRGVSGFFEVQSISIQEDIIVDIFSGDSTARTRKEEVIMALKSNFSQQKQELYSIKIVQMPNSFIDLSNVETSRRLNRYNITVPIFSWRTKEKTIDYFDTYDYEILTNK